MKFVLTVSCEDCTHKTTIRQLCPTTQEGDLTIIKHTPKANPGFPELVSQKEFDRLIAETTDRANVLIRARGDKLKNWRGHHLLAETSVLTKNLEGATVEIATTIFASGSRVSLAKSEE